VEALRTAFLCRKSTFRGKKPAEFKLAVRNFNSFKKSFYKEIKKEQNENLVKKNALVAKAKNCKRVVICSYHSNYEENSR
jgi:N-methylhydantoinase A/oxoprolinase/acetone carboxylase beta subunit